MQAFIHQPIQRVASCELGHGAIITMEGYFQKVYLHRVRKSPANTCRYNLTIRFLVTHPREHCCLEPT